MRTRVNIHIESDESGDILDNTTISLHIAKPLTSEYLAQALIEYTCDTYYDYVSRNVMPEYVKIINSRNDNPMAEFMRIIMLSLSQEIDPRYMAHTVHNCILGDDKQSNMKKLMLIISNLAERQVIETTTTNFCQQEQETDIKWRSPRIPMLTSVRHMCEEERWKMWWQAYFGALKQYSTRNTTPHHTPYTPQINEEELLTFLAQ